MNEEKESAAIKYEAEVTSLKLQLERCRNELVHYTAEANRLSQQLRLKTQMEEEQYKKHLESNVSSELKVLIWTMNSVIQALEHLVVMTLYHIPIP